MNRKYTLIMVLSFIYGGFLLTSYSITLYSVFMKEELPGPLGIFVNEGVPGVHGGIRQANEDNWTTTQNASAINVSSSGVTDNVTDNRRNNSFNQRQPFMRRVDPMEAVLSPFMILYLAGGIICIANGLAIRQLTHEKEVKKMRADLTELLLNPEEKLIMEELKKAGGELTQKNLTEITGYSRVKTHRVIQKLEEKKIVRKIPNGQTNKIILEKG
jgi:uncharacterized membrane protein